MENINKIWKGLTRNTYLSDLFLMIFFCVVMAWFHNGSGAVRIIVVALITSLVFEFLFNALFRSYVLKKNSVCDFPLAAYMGICTALMLPGQAPLWLPIAGIAAAYLLTSVAIPLLSGSVLGLPKLQIEPAGAAITFLTVFFSKIMFTYVTGTGEIAESFVGGEAEPLQSIAKMLSDGTIAEGSTYGFWDFFTGAVTGPMGTTCAVVLVAALVYLILRRPAFSLAPLGFVAGAALWALIFPRHSIPRLQSVAFELFSGTLLFTAVFLLSLPKYLPKNHRHRLIYGFLCAVLAMLLRRILPYEESVCIAVLIMNFSIPFFNKQALKNSPSSKTGKIKNKEIVGDVPEFMKKSRGRDDILDDFLE